MGKTEISIYPEKEAHDVIRALNLFFTEKCNLDCKYCFVNKQKMETLDALAISKSIKMLFSSVGQRKIISFNGGEPLTQWQLLRKTCVDAIASAEKSKTMLDVVVVTNGTLLTQEMIDFFVSNKISLKVSIDGKKATHDLQRPIKGKSGESAFDLLMERFESIDLTGLQISASMVFTPESTLELPQNIDFLVQKNFASIEFYRDIFSEWQGCDLQNLRKALKEFEKYYVASFKEGRSMFKNNMLDMVVNKPPLSRMENCQNIQIDCQGNFYLCDKVFSLDVAKRNKYVIGNIGTGIDEKKRSSRLASLRTVFADKSGLKCNGCKYQKYCFCPIGHLINIDAQENTATVQRRQWRSFCAVSKVLFGTFLNIAQKLEFDEKFVEMYRF